MWLIVTIVTVNGAVTIVAIVSIVIIVTIVAIVTKKCLISIWYFFQTFYVHVVETSYCSAFHK